VLLCAPVGFGKTTLALDWLQQASRPFAWLPLDAHDNDPARFAAHLAAALRTLAARASGSATEPAFTPAPAAIEEIPRTRDAERPAARAGAEVPDADLHPVALTEREQEVLHHLARGQSNTAIARSTFVSNETVNTHLKHIFAKLGAANRTEALERADASGLLRVVEPV
jgi:ATP/maltotriose-dependent transcriptional regulator MalT